MIHEFFAQNGLSASQLLLDKAPNASIALSLRKLRALYTGAAIRVRRSSDNTETDIGFDINGNLNQSQLAAFAGSAQIFISRWYDQSGNANDATQSVLSHQPQLNLNASGNYAGLQFSAASAQYFNLVNTLSFINGYSACYLVKKISQNNALEPMGNSTNNAVYQEWDSGGNLSFSQGTTNNNLGYGYFSYTPLQSTSLTLLALFTNHIYNSGSTTFYYNNPLSINMGTGTLPRSVFDRVGFGNNTYSTGNLFEITLWDGYNTNESNIITNQKTYYGL
jgi:hypothetical protein